MKDILKNILFAKTKIRHFFIAFISSIFFCSAVYILLIPLLYFSFFGSGESSSKITDLPINIFVQDWFALIITSALLFLLLIRNIKIENLAFAKSYLLIIIAIITLYLFKIPMGNKLIEIFKPACLNTLVI